MVQDDDVIYDTYGTRIKGICVKYGVYTLSELEAVFTRDRTLKQRRIQAMQNQIEQLNLEISKLV